MPRRLAAARLTAAAVATAVLWPAAAVADAPQVNAALLFLQATCGIRDARLESRRAEGRLLLTLRTPQFTRQTNLVHNDLRQFTEEAMKKNSEMPPELGACFDPASNQVINVLMELPPNVASLPLAPPPAPPAAAQGGGYVPPMVATPAPAAPPMVVQATPAAPAAAVAAPGVTANNGPLSFGFATMELNPAQYSQWNQHVVGTLGIDIRNNTANLLKIAVIDPWPVIQLDGGLRMGLQSINGAATNRNANANNCASYASSFTPVRPGQTLVTNAVFDIRLGGRDMPVVNGGRLTGEVLIYDEAAGRCTVEQMSVPRVAARMNR
jgi:hypothetical protein